MNIFISYARIDRSFCILFVDKLGAYEIWLDKRLYAGVHWWKEILRRIEWSNIFIYLLSPESVNSKYCRQELKIALRLKKPVIPILIQPGVIIPPELDEMHYIDMTEGFTVDNITDLLNSIVEVSKRVPRKKRRTQATTSNIIQKLEKISSPLVDDRALISEGANALHNSEFDRAIMLFEQAIAKEQSAGHINVERLLEEAKIGLAKQTQKRKIEQEFNQIVALLNYPETKEVALDALESFANENHDHQEAQALIYEYQSHFSQNGTHPTFTLPLLEWCSVTGGTVQLDRVGGPNINETEYVPDFRMSKFPVTNEQFNEFTKDPNGYENDEWWEFSDQAYEWHITHPTPLPSKYGGNEKPRETINWYEAMAFCHWLSSKLGYAVTLPRFVQWQRAVQGDSNRTFPWGDDFEEDRCNTRESELRMTTDVNRYPNGISPFEIYDLVGNTWEWCLDTEEPKKEDEDCKRGVIGGSYVSTIDKAQVSFRYYLHPESRYSSIGLRLVTKANG